MPVHLSRPTAAAGEDPASAVSKFWNSLEELFDRRNEQLAESGKPAGTWKELAEKFGINERTLSGWRTGRILPSGSRPLIKVAVDLGGQEKDWLARWRYANAAHQEALTASRQSPAEPDSTAGHVQVEAPEPQLEDRGEPTEPVLPVSSRRERHSHRDRQAGAPSLLAALPPCSAHGRHRRTDPCKRRSGCRTLVRCTGLHQWAVPRLGHWKGSRPLGASRRRRDRVHR